MSYEILIYDSKNVELKYYSEYSVHKFSRPRTRQQMLSSFKRYLEENRDSCIIPGFKDWILDLDKLKEKFPELSPLDWFRGKIALEPEAETGEIPSSIYAWEMTRDRYRAQGIPEMQLPPKEYYSKVFFIIVPEAVKNTVIMLESPVEIQHSLRHFKLDFPNPDKAAFIIMRFAKTKVHEKILEGIKKALETCGIVGIRSDEKQYHDDLLQNVMTFMHGCGFGVAVFERIEKEDFNPNISMEVGYMMALRKPVCLLKDKSLKTLHTDLMGRVYQEFDPQDPVATISQELSLWLQKKGFVSSGIGDKKE